MDSSLIEEPLDTIPGLPPGESKGRRSMKLVSCIIRPERLEAVKDALNSLRVVGGMTVTDVRGFGRQKGQVEHYRGGEYTIRFIPKVKVDVAVQAVDVDAVMVAVSQAAGTGQVGDGKIFVTELLNAMRIRTGERGTGVL